MLKEKLVELAACATMTSILASMTDDEVNNLYSTIITERSRRWGLQMASAHPSVELDVTELQYLSQGNKIDAIKRYHSRNKCSLAEAKNFIEQKIESQPSLYNRF